MAAKKLGLNATAMVMLQIVGGAAGQMVSISNILGGFPPPGRGGGGEGVQTHAGRGWACASHTPRLASPPAGGRAVMGLQGIPEGRFIRAAAPACLAYYLASTVLALPFLFS